MLLYELIPCCNGSLTSLYDLRNLTLTNLHEQDIEDEFFAFVKESYQNLTSTDASDGRVITDTPRHQNPTLIQEGLSYAVIALYLTSKSIITLYYHIDDHCQLQAIHISYASTIKTTGCFLNEIHVCLESVLE